MLETGSMAAVRASGGYVVLGAIDYLFILSPVRVGEMLSLYSWVIGATRRTLDVLVYAEAQPGAGAGGEARPVSLSLQTYVAVDEDVRPRPHGVAVEPCSLEARPLAELHGEWLGRRRGLIEERRRLAADTSPLDALFKATSYLFVGPEEELALPGVMDASRLFRYIDEVGAVSAIKYTGMPVVTASFDAAVFASPARMGDMVRMEAGLTGAGRTSLEVAIKIVAENPVVGREATVARLYAVYVALGLDGRPAPLRRRPVFSPERLRGYEERKRMREERRRRLSELLALVRGLAGR